MSSHSELHQYLCVLCVKWLWRCVGGDESDSQIGSTPLLRAAMFGRTNCVRLLIDAGADKEATGYVRATVAAFLLLIPLVHLNLYGSPPPAPSSHLSPFLFFFLCFVISLSSCNS
jgi:hypothetical protein